MSRSRKDKGFSLIEVLTVTVIITILASVAAPLLENSIRRDREIELRRALRMMRNAIDEFKKFVDENKIEVEEETYGYPETLEDLIEGIEYRDKENKSKIAKFLRRIPYDPITRSYDWGKRSYQDRIKARRWGRENVWDVYCDSDKKALDGTRYKDW